MSQPHRIRFDDGRVYAVKFDNPFPNFGLRVLPAELIASRVARSLAVPVPEIRVVSVSSQFLARNPRVAFQLENNATEQPKPGRCLGSLWIEDAKAVWPKDVPKTRPNLDALAALFVAANLLCMCDDHAQSYGNLLLDSHERVWVIDWGHPFRFPDSCNDWSAPTLMKHVEWLAPIAKPLLDIAEVQATVIPGARRTAEMSQTIIAEAFEEIPGEWKSPNPGGLSESDCAAAHDFLLRRKAVLPGLIARLVNG